MSLQNKVARANSGGMPGSGFSTRPTVGRAGMQGDPGIFGDIWGGIKRIGGAVAGGALGLATGGPGGAISGVLRGAGIIPKPPGAPQLTPMLNPRQFQQTPTRTTRVDLTPLPGAIYESTEYAGGPPPSGYHWNKSSYFLRDGTFVAKGTKLVKNRRRNPMNPRALDRAMGRITSAKRASKKLSRITIRKPASCK